MRDKREYWDKMAEKGPDRSVMDHNDRRGHKNKYLAYLRDHAILNSLKDVPPSAGILDFGCGTGNISRMLCENGYNPVGVDISLELLRHTRDQSRDDCLFVQYDGQHLPFPSNYFNACVTHEVLIHLTDNELLSQCLKEIIRVVKPGGLLIAVEQIRRKSVFKEEGMKMQRSEKELLQLLESAGFSNRENNIIRRGHFPLIYLIRYGLVPEVLFPYVGMVESFFGKVFKTPIFDYANMTFVAEKPFIKG
jgi:SAM-dependent methyltransferase